MKNRKLLLVFIVIFSSCLWLLGCKKDDSSKVSSDTEFMTVDGNSITLAQARYYAYNKQANYEIYYLASGTVIDWDAPYYDDSDITLEQLVKTEVLEQMKEAALVCEYAKSNGITLDDEDITEVESMSTEFLSNSKKELLDKVQISKDDLIEIYTRQMYCRKIYEKFQIADDTNAQNTLFKELLIDSTVSFDSELWDDIDFDEAIYTAEDVEEVVE